MPKPEKTKEEEIDEAIDDVKKCMLDDIKAGRLALNASIAKEKSHYALLKAKERLYAIERN